MEHNVIQWLGAPCCRRGSFSFYKSFTQRADAGTVTRTWHLGEFYLVRCGPREAVCIAEVTLMWEDQVKRHNLASARLYFLPEDTPKGRTPEHGEDEVLAFAKKIVVHLEDLVKWTCPTESGWKAFNDRAMGRNGIHAEKLLSGTRATVSHREGLEDDKQYGVKVLSYPQYCRFRSLQSRVQEPAAQRWVHDPHLLALGGAQLGQRDTWVLYCRDTFFHPDLENNPGLWTHLGISSLSLRGRPRKRKSRDGQGVEVHSQHSWIERMKENVMGSAEMGLEGDWLPHPEEQRFLDQLYAFMQRRGSPISKVPNLGFKKVDIYLLFSVVKRLGGYEAVTVQRLWKQVYNELGGNPGNTSAATCTRRHYEKLLLPYDQHLKRDRAEESHPLAPVTPVSCNKTKRVKTVPKQHGEIGKPEGTVVPRRGRPRGRRHVASRASNVMVQSQDTSKPVVDPNQKPDSSSFLVVKNLSTTVHDATCLSTCDSSVKRPTLITPLPLVAMDQRVKVDNESSCAPFLAMHVTGSPVNNGLPKDFSSIDHLRARLGLEVMSGSGVSYQDPAVAPPPYSVLLLQPVSRGGEDDHDLNREGNHHASGKETARKCHPECANQEGKLQHKLPLKVLPLDIDCSLQVRQLMHTPLGSAQLNSFTKKLSEVLAQDLNKACPPIASYQEQVHPLNLSKRPTTKRSTSDHDAKTLPSNQDDGSSHNGAKLLTVELGPVSHSSLPVKSSVYLTHNLAQEEPTDLSSPKQAKYPPNIEDLRSASPSPIPVERPFCQLVDQVKVVEGPERVIDGTGPSRYASANRRTRTIARLEEHTVKASR